MKEKFIDAEKVNIQDIDQYECHLLDEDCILSPKIILSSIKSDSIKEIKDYKVNNSTLENLITSFFRFLILKLEQNIDSFNSRQNIKAVLSVPAEYSEVKRKFIEGCAKKAYIDVLKIVSEPTAAAIGYGLFDSTENLNDNNQEIKYENENIMVYDLGGGTLDVSITLKENSMYTTVALAGNNELGGQNFTHCLVKSKNSKEYLDSLTSIEKRKLFARFDTKKVKISTSGVGLDEFNKNCSDLFDKVIEPIKAVLKNANISKNDISTILLTGGASQMPEISNKISQLFGKNVNILKHNPYSAVSSGCSILASMLLDNSPVLVSALDIPGMIKLTLN
ncbi:MAG: Heat shock 70 kDa protein 13 [Paramarteilia canceri]